MAKLEQLKQSASMTEYIERSKYRHGPNTFDYSLIGLEWPDKVILTCTTPPAHITHQSQRYHLESVRGCSQCNIDAKKPDIYVPESVRQAADHMRKTNTTSYTTITKTISSSAAEVLFQTDDQEDQSWMFS